MVKRVKDEVLEKLGERLMEEDSYLAETTSNAKINCWSCGNYEEDAEQCYICQSCTTWTLKKIFLHNKRYLRHLNCTQLRKMGFST